ncbi:hypothetical protein N5P37_010809, partial [Trichoderma harzianum]
SLYPVWSLEYPVSLSCKSAWGFKVVLAAAAVWAATKRVADARISGGNAVDAPLQPRRKVPAAVAIDWRSDTPRSAF